MRILLTNDDGIHAPGLAVLEAIARTISDDIWICAPEEEQSGAGLSLTLPRPVRLRQHGERRFSVTGTPTDAVTLGLRKVMPDAPDLILSGVNRGANLGDDVTYSGTVSAALEGTLAGIRSIALSQVYAKEGQGNDVSFAAAEAWGEKVIRPCWTRRSRRARWSTSTSRRSPPMPCGACAWRGRGSMTMPVARWSRGTIRAALPITGSASTGSSTPPATRPILRRLPMVSSP